MNNHLREKIQTIIGAEISAISHLSGGMISEVIKVSFKNHFPLVAKLSDKSLDLSIEGFMLNYLKSHSDLPIPSVIHAEQQLLLIEYIESSTGITQQSQKQLGELLGALHQITNTRYGLERDTLIGPLHQPNSLSDSWITFFREQRLLYMSEIALKSGNLPQTTYSRLQKLAEKIYDFIVEPQMPVLIHGDVWTTNILVKKDQIVGIIDPAIYYAHNEMELAYMALFGNFGRPFFDSYQRFIPVDVSFFEVRRHIYGLYPLLVHVTIFGGGYANSVDATLRRFGF